ncbi:helicase associated domain-containing protein [Leifsonia sp. EB34]|uniref:helicase associated domain-containing protein n=1 Tax=Leifsonia sp. EB34 TaxID=3156303 RepID=UPI00351101B4
MDSPAYLRELRETYRRMQTVPWQRLTAEQQRSLHYFLADTGGYAAGPVAGRVTRWVAAVHAIDAYVAEYGQIPRRTRGTTGFSPQNQRLAFWLEGQRRLSVRAGQCTYQRLRIAAFPGLDPRDPDARWQATYELYTSYLREHGSVPAARSHDPLERSLSVWATRQRSKYREGTLPARRVAALSLLPVWSFGRGRASKLGKVSAGSVTTEEGQTLGLPTLPYSQGGRNEFEPG